MSQLYITLYTPDDDSSITICNTVTVSGKVSDDASGINIVVTGDTKTCNATTDSSGWFSCVLANLPDDAVEINAVDDNGNYEPGVANVTTDSSECLFQPAFSTQPSSRQAASAAIHPTYTFSKVPEKSYCRLTVKSLSVDRGETQQESQPAIADQELTFKQIDLDPNVRYLLKTELLDADGQVTHTAAMVYPTKE